MAGRTGIIAGAFLLAAAAVQPVSAQADVDSRWQAFVGCWAPIVQNGEQSAADHIVCFRPDGNAVDVVTVAGGEITGEQHIAPDAGARTVRAEQCEGTETASWSQDGARIYLRSTMQCGENVLGRESAGVFALIGPNTLVEVEAVGVEDEYGVRVQQYRALAAADHPASLRNLASLGNASTRIYAAAPLSLDDIIEANDALPMQALQAMLVNTPTTNIDVDANTLVALSDAGVDPDVIDVIVALAYPERFALAAAPPQEADARDYAVRERMFYPYDPFRYDPYGRYGFGRYNSYYGYGYNPYYNAYGYGWYPGGSRVIIIDRDATDNEDRTRPGRLVKGSGFTSPGSRPSSSGTPSRSARPRVERSQPSTSTGAASTQSGSSSSSTERRAKPKPPTN